MPKSDLTGFCRFADGRANQQKYRQKLLLCPNGH
ncbi:hypothetical protein SAMN04488564_11638 [Lentzea waywayandensis]|uniref:Uncharacterized protein n=1 Tax=Lentzea waywayandensis TaxID=84724 RepID=A0A1I6FG58_9PSEU|nr:hypothetical protein SAMN04488564_11638 [Lentzea waywayandensis]